MSELKSVAFIALSVVCCGYLGVWAYLLNEKPVQKPAPYHTCIDNCTINVEYQLSEAYQHSLMYSALNQIFQSYTEEEVGYYVSCNSDRCALWVYVNTPSKLAPILRRLENEVTPLFDNESHYFDDEHDGATYSHYSLYGQFYGIFRAIHHQVRQV